MRIYITHCSKKKDDSLKNTGEKVPPDRLYTATPTKRFMQRCKDEGVKWAIFSDKYGVWFPNIKNEWYEKDPGKVTEQEFKNLLNDFDQKLRHFDEIWFYYNPSRFHPLYKRLLQETRLRNKVREFSCIAVIE